MTDTDLLGPGSGDEPMTVKLSEIEKAAEGATPGAWEDAVLFAESGKRKRYEVIPERDAQHEVARVPLTDAGEADATFIAASRTAIPALTAALRDVLALHFTRHIVISGNPPLPCDACGHAMPCPTVRAITAHVDPT